MSDTETLRQAAALMRERVEAADPGLWDLAGPHPRPGVADYVASWHPAVALAVAAWLDNCADRWRYGPSSPEKAHATVIASAYLQETP